MDTETAQAGRRFTFEDVSRAGRQDHRRDHGRKVAHFGLRIDSAVSLNDLVARRDTLFESQPPPCLGCQCPSCENPRDLSTSF